VVTAAAAQEVNTETAGARERFPHQCPPESASPPLGAGDESGKVSLDFAVRLELYQPRHNALVNCDQRCGARSSQSAIRPLGIGGVGLPPFGSKQHQGTFKVLTHKASQLDRTRLALD
jgi:hypothetical protein